MDYPIDTEVSTVNATAKVTMGAISVRQELSALGLKPDDLAEAISFGEKYRALCTDNDPRIFQGTTAWARTLRGLRENKRLVRLGWTKDRTGNFETAVSPNKTFAISVTTGDKETGKYDPERPFLQPRLKHPKGIMTKAAIDVNAWLFPDMAADAKKKADEIEAVEKRATWILLIHRDGNVVFSELSLASKFSSGQVDQWKHRIVLDPLDVEPLIDVADDSGDDSGEADIDVPVRRRT
jgi:hypothetical protein